MALLNKATKFSSSYSFVFLAEDFPGLVRGVERVILVGSGCHKAQRASLEEKGILTQLEIALTLLMTGSQSAKCSHGLGSAFGHRSLQNIERVVRLG